MGAVPDFALGSAPYSYGLGSLNLLTVTLPNVMF